MAHVFLSLLQLAEGQAGITPQDQAAGALNYLSSVILAQANTLAFQDIFLAISVVVFIAAWPAWLIGHRPLAY